MRYFLLFIVSVLLITPGCDDPESPTVCDALEVYGIMVEVRDITDGSAIADGAVARVSEGDYADTLMECGDDGYGHVLTLCGAKERPGTYTLTIEKEGYLTYTQDDISVPGGRCHVECASFAVDMRPDVTLGLELRPASVRAGETVEIRLSVTNNSGREVVFHYGSSCVFGYDVIDEGGETAAWFPQACNWVLTDLRLAVGETHEESELLSTSGWNIGPGTYTVRAGMGYGYRAEAQLAVEP